MTSRLSAGVSDAGGTGDDVVTDEVIARRMRQARILAVAARQLTGGDVDGATATCLDGLEREATTLSFPIPPGVAAAGGATGPVVPRSTVPQRMRIAVRDGFVDRYSPERWQLVNPGAMRVLNLRVGDVAFPTVVSSGTIRAYRGNAPVWWDCWPTVDHRTPRSRGGGGDDANLICTSWWRNDTKRAMATEETGWSIQPAGDLEVWDGLSRWFLTQVARDPGLRADAMVRSYERATRPLFDRDAVGGAP